MLFLQPTALIPSQWSCFNQGYYSLEGCHIQRSSWFLGYSVSQSHGSQWLLHTFQNIRLLWLTCPHFTPFFFFFLLFYWLFLLRFLGWGFLFCLISLPGVPQVFSSLHTSIYIGTTTKCRAPAIFVVCIHISRQLSTSHLYLGILHLIFPMCKSHSPSLTLHSKSQKMTASST